MIGDADKVVREVRWLAGASHESAREGGIERRWCANGGSDIVFTFFFFFLFVGVVFA